MGGEIKSIYRLLLKEYGEQGWWPINRVYSPSFKKRKRTPEERLEIAVGAILTQNTSWENVEKALKNLRGAEALSREGLGKLTEKELATLVRPAGYYNMKAKKIREYLSYSGGITREGLLGVWGLGPETVDSILLYAYGQPMFVVDAYTKRILRRMGLCGEKAAYSEIQELFQKELKEDAALFNEYHALLVRHAKEHCRVKPVCEGCPLWGICRRGKGEKDKREKRGIM
ncbi:endonuclease [Candidatus Micrarchaeota archaeon]|nr:endonuclease [Candidatus Micrarchaeota archaeon]MBD3417587.1 endonuclease [Candidatus Micrarchaeota archaeon]